MSAKITVDVHVANHYDKVSEQWRITWNMGSNIAHVRLLQPEMEWQIPVNIPPFAPVAGVTQTLEKLVRNYAAELVA